MDLGVDEPLVPQRRSVGQDVMPAGLRGKVLGVEQHVGVEQVQDLTPAVRHADP